MGEFLHFWSYIINFLDGFFVLFLCENTLILIDIFHSMYVPFFEWEWGTNLLQEANNIQWVVLLGKIELPCPIKFSAFRVDKCTLRKT